MKNKLFALCLLLSLLLFPSCKEEDSNGFHLYFLDVGQGDCILFQSKDGTVLVDSGTDLSEGWLCYRLTELGVTKIDYFFLTHSDADHSGGADGIFKSFEVSYFCRSDETENEQTDAFYDLIGENTQSLRVFEGDSFSLGSLQMNVLSPVGTETDANDASIVLQFVYGDFSALLMGDAGTSVEERLVEQYGESLQCNLLKVGHHGSSTSTSSLFLDTVKPDCAVISVGYANDYGHPHGAVLSALAERNISVYRTDLQGELHFYFDCTKLNLIEDKL